jgi:secondary thiamine-phosphate synthase enzyme
VFLKPILLPMKIFQKALTLRPYPRGFHLITSEVLRAIPELKEIQAGICQVFIQHTSASLTINENADPTVRTDFRMYFDKMVPENDPEYQHDDEGDDDMPAHLKSALLDTSITFPVSNGRPALGIWQGIYLCEHRNHGGHRHFVITCWGN